MSFSSELAATPSSTRLLGLVIREGVSGEIILSHSKTLLAELIPALSSPHGSDTSDHILLQQFSGLRVDEIKAARAYRARFGDDLRNPAPLPTGAKSLLLDENIPYTILPLVTSLFGFSSHVEAEGLSRQNLAEDHKVPRSALDSRICRFAADSQFAGILTQDADFMELYAYPGHPVRKLHVFLINGADTSLAMDKKIIRHQHSIRKALASGQPDLIRL